MLLGNGDLAVSMGLVWDDFSLQLASTIVAGDLLPASCLCRSSEPLCCRRGPKTEHLTTVET
jgi:hypothetical protein